MPSKRALMLGLALMGCVVNAQESSLNVLDLRNRSAEDLLPQIQPLLESDERVIADGFRLVIKSRPERYSAIEQLVQQLDRPQTNLLISIIENSYRTAQQMNAEFSASLSGNRLQMNGMAGDTRDADDHQHVQQIRTLDGLAARIETGQQRPVESMNVYANGYGYTRIRQQTQQQNASSGFVVIPYLVDHQTVMLEISPWSQQWQNNMTQQQSSLHTTVRVRLGEWTEIGSQSNHIDQQQQGMEGLNYQTQDQQQHLLLKVEKLTQ